MKRKVWLWCFLFFFSLLSMIFFSFLSRKEEEKRIVDVSIEVIEKILNYDLEKVDEDFLLWIKQNYSTSILEKILVSLENHTYQDSLWHDFTGQSFLVLQDYYHSSYENMDNVKIKNPANEDIHLSFVGDVSLADNWYVMQQMDKRNQGLSGILSKEVEEILVSSDIMVLNNEFSISNRGSALKGKQYTFKGAPERLSLYHEMGVDLVTLANNHVYDYGKEVFEDTLFYLKDYDIPYVGAGYNIEEAKRPYYFIIGGYKIAFVNASRAEKYLFTKEATETEGGILKCYDTTLFEEAIFYARKTSDYVVALVHWGREGSHELEEVQETTGKIYIEKGADVVIGTHAHTLQGITFYQGKPIIYNLGNFLFNEKTIDTAILNMTIHSDGTLSYQMIPCLQKNTYTSLLREDEKEKVLSDIRSWSTNTIIEEDGTFYAS